MALGPGPAGLKFSTPQGVTADNTADIGSLPASVGDQFNPWGPKRPVQDWVLGSSPLFAPVGAPFTLTGDAGSYAIAGTAAGLVVNDTVNLPAGSANWFNPWGPKRPVQDWFSRPIPTAPAVPVTLTAAGGSYAITGTAAGLTIPGSLPAAAGSYTISGTSASLTVASSADTTNLPAGAVNWFNPWGRRFPINLRTSTGRPLAEVAAPVTLTAAAGSYVITGTAAALTVTGSLTLTAAGGSYAITGSAASLTVTGNFVLGAASGSYAITGTSAALTVSGNQVLAAAAGSYEITGSSAALALGLTANSGSYALSGAAAALATGFVAGAGSYAITGTDAQIALVGNIIFACDAGSYTLTGSSIRISPPDQLGGGGGAAAKLGRRYPRFRKKRDWRDELQDLLADLVPPTSAPQQPAPRSFDPRPVDQRSIAARQVEDLLSYIEKKPPPIEAAIGAQAVNLDELLTTAASLDRLPRFSLPQISSEFFDEDDDEEAVALLLAVLFE